MDEVVIVGAGPAGLAAAATLRARGIDATILERGERVGEPWRARYDRLHLHTVRWLSNLPGYRIPRGFGKWVARDQFVQYLEQYAAYHRLEPRFGVEAMQIDRDNGHWAVKTSDGTVSAGVVVVASGYTRVPHLPRWPGGFDGPLTHSADYRNPRPYHGQDVLIVGAGNSGTEIAVDLAEGGAGRVRIAVRRPPNILRRDIKGFPTQLVGLVLQRTPTRLLNPVVRGLRRATIRDLSAWGLPRPNAPFSQFRRTATVPVIDVGFVDAVRRGIIEVVPGVTALDGGAVVLADGSRVFPDCIVAATGYHPGLEPRRQCHGDRRTRHPEPAASSPFPRNRHTACRAAAPGWQGRSTAVRHGSPRVGRREPHLTPTNSGFIAESREQRSPSVTALGGPRDDTGDGD